MKSRPDIRSAPPWFAATVRRWVIIAASIWVFVVAASLTATLFMNYSHATYELIPETHLQWERFLIIGSHLTLFSFGMLGLYIGARRATRRIREQARTEEALRVRDRFNRKILDAVPGIVYIYDIQKQRYLYANRHWLKDLGYETDDLAALGDDFFRGLLHPDDVRELETRRKTWHRLDDESVLESEFRIRSTSDAWRWYLVRETVFMRDSNKKVWQILGVTQDITERKRFEEALRLSESNYRDLFENAYDLIYTLDVDQRITSLNKLVEEVMGFTREEILGRSINDFLAPEYVNLGLENFQSKLDGVSSRTRYEVEAISKSGERIPLEVQSRLIMRDGQVLGVQGTARDLRSRKRFEHQLRLLSTGLNAAATAIVIANASGRITWANPAFTRLTGYSLEQVQHDNLPLLDPEEHGPAFVSDLWQTISSGRVWRGELVRRRREGGIYSEEMTVAPVRNDPGEITHYIAIRQDITERKRAQQVLQDSEGRLRQTLQNMPVMMLAFDAAWNILVWNRECERVTGYRAEEMVNNSNALAWLYPDIEYRDKLLAELEAHGQNYKDWEWHVTCKSGEVRVIAWSSEAEHFPIPGWATWGIGVDVTERKQAEQALIERRRFIEAITDHLPLGFAVNTMTDGKTIYVNKSFERIYGWPRESMQDITSFFEHVYPDVALRKDIREKFFADIASNDPARLHWDNIRITREDGEHRYISAQNIPLPMDGLMISTVWDVTDQVHATREREKLEAQVRQSQRLESLGVLAGGIAHDFNNILAAIIGYSEMATDDAQASDRARHHIEEVLRAATRAKQLVTQILTFSRRSHQERQPVAMHLLMKETLNLMRASLPTTVTIRASIQEDCGFVLADPAQMQQIIMNLCTNAYQAMGGRGGTIELTLDLAETITEAQVHMQYEPMPMPAVRLVVQDNGDGMDPALLERIFEPFFTTKETGEGTGMGLAIVHGTVTSYGGAVTVDSSPGIGSRFCVYLPRYAEQKAATPAEPEQTPQGSEHILFVDDEETLARMGPLLLERLGYSVQSYTSAGRALEAFMSQPAQFDLLVTDFTMPEYTGLELAMEIRRIRPELPVIIVTGYSELLTAEEAQKQGINDYLLKPITLHELGSAVRKVLDSAQRNSASHPTLP
jgi:PAS domain S-box-containing protein